MTEKASFSSFVDFCPECGSILPLPGLADVVMCTACKFKMDVKEFDGIEVKSRVVFNTRQTKAAGLTSADFAGPVVEDKKCARCGNEGMVFATRQTRSADEGQTVFYTCPKCGFQEMEYS